MSRLNCRLCLHLLLLTLSLLAPASRAQQESLLDRARAEASASRFDQAAELYRQMLQVQPDNPDALGGLADALEAMGQWSQAIPYLSQLVKLQPANAPRLFQLGRMMSWQESRRDGALILLKHAVDLEPANASYLIGYAEVLSWRSATRSQAKQYYERILAKDPRNVGALLGEARVLAWGGESERALAFYEQVLRIDPENVTALRREAEILNWRGRYSEARKLLARARQVAPEDTETLLELARADLGLGHYAEARASLAQVHGEGGSSFKEIQREVDQALGTYVEMGFGVRRNRQRLDYEQLEAVVSAPLGAGNRLSLFYRPTLFASQPGHLNSNYYALALDSQPSDKTSLHSEFGGETYPGSPPQLDGAFEWRYRPKPSVRLEASFNRQAVDDTPISTRGLETSGLFLGPVRSNLVRLRASYWNAAHRYDVSTVYSDGAYTGRNLDANRRWGVDVNVGKSLRGDRPYIRIAYGFSYISFDHDADFQPGTAQLSVTGGYFSPTRFLLNNGGLFLSQKFGRKLVWEARGALGVQNIQTTTSSFSAAQLASTFSTNLSWHVTFRNDLSVSYDFLNVYAAFRRNLLRVTWRSHF